MQNFLNMKLSYVLTLFLGLASFSKVNTLEIVQGKCPHEIGTIKSDVAQSLDYERISGAWITIYDENDLKDLYTCMGIHLAPTSNADEQTELKFD